MAVRTPIIAIVGRPNVGKSTFFNRLIGEKRAVVEDVAGVTRDRLYGLSERFSVPFYVVDTGGLAWNPTTDLEKAVVAQAHIAIEDADRIIVLFDGNGGLHPDDRALVQLLRERTTKVSFAVNKCDGLEQSEKVIDFYELGLDHVYQLSAKHGVGVRDLIEDVLQDLPNYEALVASAEAKERELQELEANVELERHTYLAEAVEESPEENEVELKDDHEPVQALAVGGGEPEFAPVFVPGESSMTEREYERLHRYRARYSEGEEPTYQAPEPTDDTPEPVHLDSIRLAIVGRPNVGKSTLLNTLTGQERAITSSVAGTTRDALEVTLTRDGQEYVIVDTAGLRKKARVEEDLEHYATMRSLAALRECDVSVLLIDATTGPVEQDTKIAGMAHQEGRGLVIVVNKWDAIEKDHRTVQKTKETIAETFKFARYAPIVFVSAISGRRCPRIIETVHKVAHTRMERISTAALVRVLRQAMAHRPPPLYRGRSLKLYFASQIDTGPPRIVLFVNYPRAIHFSYLRYLKNALRDRFPFEGTDIKLVVRKH